MNENQNYFVRRPTSRVLNRPGGTCQITLGGYTEAELENMRKRREAKNNPAAVNASIGTENEKKASTNEKAPIEPTKEKETVAVAKETVTNKPVLASAVPVGRRPGVSSNAFASSSTTNSFNVLTDRPTSKVSNPPGGKCSFTLG